MKISIETNVGGRVAPPVLDRLLTRIVAVLEKGTGLKFDVKADGNTVRLAHKASLLRRAGDAMSVVYDASDDGYAVFVLDFKGQIIDEYRAGNHPQSSQDFLPLEEGGLSYEANMVAAQKTALDMAEERGINPRYVSHDSDILAEEREAPHREQLMASLTAAKKQVCPRCQASFRASGISGQWTDIGGVWHYIVDGKPYCKRK